MFFFVLGLLEICVRAGFLSGGFPCTFLVRPKYIPTIINRDFPGKISGERLFRGFRRVSPAQDRPKSSVSNLLSVWFLSPKRSTTNGRTPSRHSGPPSKRSRRLLHSSACATLSEANGSGSIQKQKPGISWLGEQVLGAQKDVVIAREIRTR